MIMTYEKRDADIINYNCYQFNGWRIRGPEVDTAKSYIVCTGAAHTFGVFCDKPFPALLADRLGIQVLNLGRGGAEPSDYLGKNFLEAINNSRLAVIQLLSGRCGSNSRYTTVRTQLGIRHDDYEVVPPVVFWRYAEEKYRKKLINKLLDETRRDYIYKMLSLIQSVKVPKILFYFSTSKPEKLPNRIHESPFPQLLRRWMIEEMAGFCDEYVECISNKGLPMKLFDKNGNPAALKRPEWESHLPPIIQNNYYPSPQMHEDAAKALEPICRKILQRDTHIG
jgi:hypothetical protein